MKIKLLMIGKTTDNRLSDLINDYVSRLKHYIVYEQIIVPELKNVKNIPVELQKEKEAELILSKTANADEVILLDEKGAVFTSKGFSDFLLKKMVTSGKDIMFVIGGPYGFSPRVYSRANFLLSLSSMTFSHQMIRLLFAEQLYRALTIIKREPYHNE